MFRKIIFLIFFGFSFCGFAADYSYHEKPPVDRQYAEIGQNREEVQAKKQFVFDPNKKIAQEDRSYQDLLAQRDSDEKSILNKFTLCDINPKSAGCPNSPAWIDEPQQLKHMMEQAKIPHWSDIAQDA
nr:hypothetical protein [Providencia sp.]